MSATPADVPPVVLWYGRYCQAAVALFTVAALYGVRIGAHRVELAGRWGVDAEVVVVFGVLWAVTLLFLAFVHYAALRTPRSPWAWKIHAVVLGIGLTTLVLWPAALPLLVYWLKPATREYFGVASPKRGGGP